MTDQYVIESLAYSVNGFTCRVRRTTDGETVYFRNEVQARRYKQQQERKEGSAKHDH